MAQMLRFPPFMWETQVKFPAPGFYLAQLLVVTGGMNQWMLDQSLFLSLPLISLCLSDK